jgi:hypothetical protein
MAEIVQIEQRSIKNRRMMVSLKKALAKRGGGADKFDSNREKCG